MKLFYNEKESLEIYVRFNGNIESIRKSLSDDGTAVTYHSILRHFKKKGVFDDPIASQIFESKNRRIQGTRRIKNEDFFTEWNTVSAYVFGVIAGDGSLHNVENKIRICAGFNEREYLEKIRDAVGSDAAITHEKDKRRPGYSGDSLTFAVQSEKWMSRLIDMGLSRSKNKNGFTLFKCPKQFQGSMMRGLYDTDGCLHMFDTLEGRRPSSISWSTKHETVKDEILNILKENGVDHIRTSTNNGGVWSVYTKDLDSCLFFLYKDSEDLFLQRKRPDSYPAFRGNLDIHDQNKGFIDDFYDAVIEMRKKGFAVMDISVKLGISRDSIGKLIKKAKNAGELPNGKYTPKRSA